MDLLTFEWIPVRQNTHFRHITFEHLLCSDNQYQLSLHRDDMELAALQLLISLAQVLLLPKDKNELRQRVKEPLTVETYRQAIEFHKDWFVLDHPTQPFMQSRGVNAKDLTPIQKLFIGLPEGNNHAFFNEQGEIDYVCGGCAAIALFNQASNCPSFGGGFKGSLRGSAPITTLIAGQHLRKTIWFNVLSKDHVDDLIDSANANSKPVWIDPIPPKAKLYTHSMGLLRGLFWQPARVELVVEKTAGRCTACQRTTNQVFTGFRKEKFTYNLEGLWPHPHSPKIWDIKKENKDRERFLSFTTTAPAWTQLNYCALPQIEQKAGSIPAPIVTQFRETFIPEYRLNLLVSGYRNNQASILERRHELFSMPQNWHGNSRYVEGAIHYARTVKDELRRKLYGFAKQVGPQVHEIAERQFFFASEPMIHELLREMSLREGQAVLSEFKGKINQLARRLFETLTAPYRHDPEGLKYFVLFKGSFEAALAKLNA
jgi:CRISPR system Cascade subunit CasA